MGSHIRITAGYKSRRLLVATLVGALSVVSVLLGGGTVACPGLTRRHSLLLISSRGARVLASIHAEHPAAYVERSRQARTYHWRAPHDLGANDFFVWLALESRDLSESGLLYWIGEETMRAHYRQIVTGRRDGVPTPDGYANYLAPAGPVTLELEVGPGY